MIAAHTPLPWRVDPRFAADIQVEDGSMEVGSTTYMPGYKSPSTEEQNANAAFIVRACNAHYGLVAALEMARGYVAIEGSEAELAQVDAALAQLKDDA